MFNAKGANLVDALHKILQFYFGNVDRQTILSIAGCSEDEFDTKSLLHVANESNLFAQTSQIDMKSLDSFLLPIIVQNSKGEVLVLEKKDEKLKDYKDGMLFFRNEKESIISSRKKELSWFFQPLKAAWRSYVEVGILSFFINLFAIALPLFTMNVYDRVIPNFATETLFVLAFGVGIIFVFEMILKSA